MPFDRHSAVCGTKTERFGLPPAVRGSPGVGHFGHFAASGTANTAAIATALALGWIYERTRRKAIPHRKL